MKKQTPAELRRRYPYFVRPLPGHFHAVEFGTAYHSNGPEFGAVLGILLNLADSYADARRDNAIKAARREMHVFPDGRIVDVFTHTGKPFAQERTERAQLWEATP